MLVTPDTLPAKAVDDKAIIPGAHLETLVERLMPRTHAEKFDLAGRAIASVIVPAYPELAIT